MEHDTHKQAPHNTNQASEPPINEKVTDILDELSNVLQGLVRYTRLPWLLKHYKRLPVLSLFSFVDSCISIGLMTVIAVITHSPFIFPSLGPTAFLFFFTPTAPSASPRNTLIGHAIGVVAGYASLIVTGLTIAGPALTVGITWSRVIAAGLSLGLTTSLMVLLRSPHPPAGATTLIVSLGILAQPWQLLLLMVAVGLLTLQAIIINRLAGIPYPLWSLRPTVSNVKQLEEEDAQAQESADSRISYQVAYDLAQLCPASLGQEITLIGSAAHGVSDEHSDIEMVFYVNKLPAVKERETWLHEARATDIIFEAEPISDGSIWATFFFHEIWIEAGWQTIAAHENNLHAILSGNVIDHQRLIIGEITAHALPLRTEGLLAKWQQELSIYPARLQPLLIANASELWMFPHMLATRWVLIERGDRLALAEKLTQDVHNVLRILFTLNQQWEPNWKWIKSETRNLTIRPEHLNEHINAIFSSTNPKLSVATCLKLILDTLILVPPPYDVARAIATIQESLRTHTLQ